MAIYIRIILYTIICGVLAFDVVSCTHTKKAQNTQNYSGYKIMTFEDNLKSIKYIAKSIKKTDDPYELILKTKISLNLIADILNENKIRNNKTKDEVKAKLNVVKSPELISSCNCFSCSSFNDLEKCASQLSDAIFIIAENNERIKSDIQSTIIDIKVMAGNLKKDNYKNQLRKVLKEFYIVIKKLEKEDLICSKPLKSDS